MKKIMSKILIIFILFVMMFEVIFSPNYALAISEETINLISNLAGGLVSILFWPKRIMVVGLSFVVDTLTSSFAETAGTNFDYGTGFNVITPFDIFFNRYKLLDVNVFDIDGAEGLLKDIRSSIAFWYYCMRTIAAMILLVVLVYVGIRMALSTVAEDKAKYKKMLFDWACSLALIFVLQYIAVFTIYCNNAIVNVLRSMLEGDTGVEAGLTEMIFDIGMKGVFGVGIPSIAAVLVFVFIVFQTIAFLIAYINRMIKVAFLVMISPLISITYSIDKMGDGKAQALNKWLSEFIFTILIQPFHCLTYIAFVRTAFSLITNVDVTPLQAFTDIAALVSDPEYNELVNGVLAILCLKFINDSEKIVRKIFGFQDDNSGTSLAAGMAVGLLAVKNMKKAGQAASKGINMAKGTSAKLSKAIGSDMQKIRQKHPGLDRNMKSLEGKFNDAKTSFNNSFAGKALNTIDEKKKGLIKGVKDINEKFTGTKIGEFVAKHNTLGGAIGVMSAAMMYSSGTSGAMDAIGMGSAVGDAADELFASTAGSISDDTAKYNDELDEKERAKLEEKAKKFNDPDFVKNVAAYENATNEAEAKEEQAAAALQMAEEKLAKIRAEKANNKHANVQESDANPEFARAEKLAQEAAALRARAAEIDKDGTIKEAIDSGEFSDGKTLAEGAQIAMNKVNATLAEFDTEDAKRARHKKRTVKPKSDEMQAKKNEIIQKLTALKLKQKTNGDTNVNNTLTTEDTDSIARTAELLTQNIERGVLQNGYSQENQANLVRHSLGLDSEADGSMMQELFAATSDYEDLQMQSQIAERHQHYQKLGGQSSTLIDKEMKKSRTPVRKKRETKN